MVVDRRTISRSMLISGLAVFVIAGTGFLYNMLELVYALLLAGMAAVLIGTSGHMGQRFSTRGPAEADRINGILNMLATVSVLITAFYDAITAAGLAVLAFAAMAAYHLLRRD